MLFGEIMKVKIENNQIKEALNTILSVVEKKSSRPILTNFFINIANNKFEIIGTDLEVSSKIILECQNDISKSFCINAKNFSDIIRELPDNTTELVFNEDQTLHIYNGSIHYSLLTIGSEDFPVIEFKHLHNPIIFNSSEISSIVEKTSYAMSTDETRIQLNGIFCQLKDDKIRFVAIDGHRLAMIDSAKFSGSSDVLTKGAIIPKKGIFELKKLADLKNTEIEISFDQSFLYLSCDNKIFTSVRLISRDYPKYETIIPSKNSFTFTFDKNEMAQAIRRVKLLASEKNHAIKFKISKNNLLIHTQNPIYGKAEEALGINYSGTDLEIGFNAKNLLENINVFNEGEIQFEFNNSLSPVVMKSDSLNEFLSIIMPLKI
jgi:DNA polymerase-3 subunit beta